MVFAVVEKGKAIVIYDILLAERRRNEIIGPKKKKNEEKDESI